MNDYARTVCNWLGVPDPPNSVLIQIKALEARGFSRAGAFSYMRGWLRL
jgi:hypothetical protein